LIRKIFPRKSYVLDEVARASQPERLSRLSIGPYPLESNGLDSDMEVRFIPLPKVN